MALTVLLDVLHMTAMISSDNDDPVTTGCVLVTCVLLVMITRELVANRPRKRK